ncbi:MAG: hypothetical protein AAF674_05140 [Pseudomonadota bacterium]
MFEVDRKESRVTCCRIRRIVCEISIAEAALAGDSATDELGVNNAVGDKYFAEPLSRQILAGKCGVQLLLCQRLLGQKDLTERLVRPVCRISVIDEALKKREWGQDLDLPEGVL